MLLKVLINNGKLELYTLSYIWLSFGLLMLLTSFLFLDWKYSFFKLPYKFNIQLELTDQLNENHFSKYLLNPLYILVVLFLSIVLISTVFLSVFWEPLITFLTKEDLSLGIYFIKCENVEFIYRLKLFLLGNKYTFVYNVSTISAILICPINGYLLGFKAHKSKIYLKKNK